jgi:hypothetical protein
VPFFIAGTQLWCYHQQREQISLGLKICQIKSVQKWTLFFAVILLVQKERFSLFEILPKTQKKS